MLDPLELSAAVANEVTTAGRALVERTRSQLELAQRVVAALPCIGRRNGSGDRAGTGADESATDGGATLTLVPDAADAVGGAGAVGGSADVGEPVPSDAPSADVLAIPDYDSLAASQVVPRLAALTSDELDDVGAYERSHRARQTILNRVRQLQSATGA